MKIKVFRDYGGTVVDNLFFAAGEHDVLPALAIRMIEHGIAEAVTEERPEQLKQPAIAAAPVVRVAVIAAPKPKATPKAKSAPKKAKRG